MASKQHNCVELLNKLLIKHYLDKACDKNLNDLIILETTPSTNDYVSHYAKTHPHDCIACLAEQQTAGKGRLGREWVSPVAANIYLSLLWPFECDMAGLTGLNIVVGVSAAQTILSFCDLPELKLKWPNDLYHHDKKLGGILIELQRHQQRTSAIIGIGINVCMPSDAGHSIDKPWTDLTQASGKAISRNQLAGVLINTLITHLPLFTTTGLTHFSDKWNKLDYLKGNTITIQSGNTTVEGIARGIDMRGYLLLEVDGETRIIATGDASIKSTK